ncbi:GNAT family protein [Arcicella sp. LKC2W]|uniref:GNAT family N-acetyltransferase n=1 Tax=Arcicella sp. LKC2W TaxID=2984198 RepID=UPI002B1F9FED|nr:GNAT family protein [Arcicella sp. LKC2W]MEA5459165.1 GNAT family protein [Arcicella sp. LKC2W]
MPSKISSQNFTLRPFKEGDQDSLVANANNIKIFNHVRDIFPYPYTHDDASWWIDANKETDKPATCFAIDIDGKVVGAVGFVLGNDIYRISAEIGYWLGENYWGKGIASEAVILMTDYTFKNFPNIERIWAGIFDFNKASMRVLEKADYHFEGIQKKSAIKNEVVLDIHVYVKFREMTK